jgi:hypothetical protein
MQTVKEVADSVSTTPDTITGSPSNEADPTATEENIKFRGFQMGVSDDVMAIAPSLVKVARLVILLLVENFDRWYPIYGQYVAIKTVDELKALCLIEVAGKSPQDSPQMQAQQADQLIQIAGAFPQAGIPVAELVKTIVESTSLANKEDLLRALDAAQQQMGMIQNAQQLTQIMGPLMQAKGLPAPGGAQGGPQPGPAALPGAPGNGGPRPASAGLNRGFVRNPDNANGKPATGPAAGAANPAGASLLEHILGQLAVGESAPVGGR